MKQRGDIWQHYLSCSSACLFLHKCRGLLLNLHRSSHPFGCWCAQEVRKHMGKSRAGWKLVRITFVQSTWWFSNRVGSNTSPMKCGFFPWSLEWAIYRHKCELALLQCPEVNCAYKREKANFMAFEVMAEISKAAKLGWFLFYTYQGPCRGTLYLGSSFSKRTQLTTLIQKSSTGKSKMFQHSVMCSVRSLVLNWLIQTTVPRNKASLKAVGVACFHTGQSSCCPGAHLAAPRWVLFYPKYIYLNRLQNQWSPVSEPWQRRATCSSAYQNPQV